MRIAYLDCFSGISGDMTLGAFLDAGLSFTKLKKELAKLRIKGYVLKRSKARRHELSGAKFDCIPTQRRFHDHRSLGQIIRIIESSSLNRRVKEISKDIFYNLGRAEAKVHGIGRNKEVRLHELGDIDSIIDIVGAAIAIDELGIDEVYSSKVSMGRTIVTGQHGRIPVPAPATMELLKGTPIKILGLEAELVTPTGAAILKTLSKGFGEPPEMAVSNIGYGAGAKDFKEAPNMLRVMIGEKKASFGQDKVYVIEANIDDMNPQVFEYLFERLFKIGALDVYLQTIQMKKSRPGFKLTVLANPADLKTVSEVIFKETSTIGVRYYEVSRLVLDRKIVNVKTKYGNVRVKVSKGPDSILNISPEYDDCAMIARTKKIPLKTILNEAKSQSLHTIR